MLHREIDTRKLDNIFDKVLVIRISSFVRNEKEDDKLI